MPWLRVLDRATSIGGAIVAGVAMCVGFALALFSWFPDAVRDYTGAPWWIGGVVLLALAPFLELQFVTFAVARHVVRRRGGSVARIALCAAAIYVGTEWLFPKVFGDTLGVGLYAAPWVRQAADVAGVPGLTFVLLLANDSASAVWVRRARLRAAAVPAGCFAALVLAPSLYGALRCRQLAREAGRERPIVAALVQADLSHYDRLADRVGKFQAVRTILDDHFALSADALRRGIDLLVWPETVYPTTFGTPKSADGAAFDREIAAFVGAAGVPLVFGAYDADAGDEFNAAVFLEPPADGRVAFETYRKARLFPLTERVPWLLQTDFVRRRWSWLGTWKPGQGGKSVALTLRDGRRVRLAPLICYDVFDPDVALAGVRDGGEVLVTLSNDSWVTFGDVPRLILVLAAFRSIETRRAQLRATNTGISAVIGPTGEILASAGVHERATITGSVEPARTIATPMLAGGEWFPAGALAGGVILLAWAGQPIFRSRRLTR